MFTKEVVEVGLQSKQDSALGTTYLFSVLPSLTEIIPPMRCYVGKNNHRLWRSELKAWLSPFLLTFSKLYKPSEPYIPYL